MQETFARMTLYNFASLLRLHVRFVQSKGKYFSRVNAAFAAHIAREFLLGFVPAVNVETLIANPIIEALNGRIKEELYLDFGLNEAENLPDLLNQYVYFFNNHRPAAALGYKSPVQYKTELGFL